MTSALAGLAPGPVWLVVLRVGQGVGGAAVMACGLGLIGQAFPTGRPRARATAAWGAALGGGVAVGPLIASGLAALGDWRLPYLVIAAAAVVLAVAGHVLLVESRGAHPRPLDLPGTLLLPLGIAALLAGLVQGRSDWTAPTTIALLATAAALLAGFVAVEHHSRSPMLDLVLFRRPDFAGATVGAFGAGAGVLALSNFVPVVLERGLGLGAVAATVVLLAWSATSVVTAFAAGRLPDTPLPGSCWSAGSSGSRPARSPCSASTSPAPLGGSCPACSSPAPPTACSTPRSAARPWPASRQNAPPWAPERTTPPATSAPRSGSPSAR